MVDTSKNVGTLVEKRQHTLMVQWCRIILLKLLDTLGEYWSTH